MRGRGCINLQWLRSAGHFHMRAPCPVHQSAEQSVSLQGTFPGGAEWDLPGCQECSWSASTGPFKTSCELRSWLAGRAQKMVSPTLLHCWASFPLLSSCCSTAASQKSGNMEARASHHLPGGGGGGPAPAQPCMRPPRLRQLGPCEMHRPGLSSSPGTTHSALGEDLAKVRGGRC